ncbi:N5-carboxyaminoimidazole ribonucleotide mutase [Candidatus Syntrophocurvum alkaliphilum]|uniref:N5-carboxyaminoimidazole ribonucleotide mutase n=1 Tax=Candidatus Syntrophocurvum alkaliphilum TaxID=2293317 RepID=A0A6I6D658_9FIRM|nr:5-(carboxyamino)imidazole ribonucleotide mutase [Candidatus Syntrophocurvum alkaliphilum]QGT98806.1 N5-carboxyaminoimidazole ribonucleotide mutase [Candidatus Syntrophocurvum alkaliphilum]
MAKVGIIMGSDSDLGIMKGACDILDQFGVEYEINVSSAHRVPDRTAEIASTAVDRGIDVIIAAAGVAAHLPGVVAAHTPVPVIGVPIKSGALSGVDALYAIVQMPKGIPVATVAIDGSANAALLALQMIGIKDKGIKEKMIAYKEKMASDVLAKDKKLQELGVEGYLKDKEKK